MRDLKFSKPTRRSDGHVGARARLSFRGEGTDGHYTIHTHGRTSSETAAEIDRIEAFHEKRAARMDGFRAIQARPIKIGQTRYKVADVTVKYAPDASHCTLYIDVREVLSERVMPRVTGFPLKLMYRTAEEIPSDAAIEALILAAIPVETEDLEKLHEEYAKKVREKVKPGKLVN